MINEIKDISNQMITLNNKVYGTILSTEDLKNLNNIINNIDSIQDQISKLLIEASFFSNTDEKKLIKALVKANELLLKLASEIEKIALFMDKFVCNYDKEWSLTQKNIA